MDKQDNGCNLDDLEPGDRGEDFSPTDWCMASCCGCGGCLDPTGCSDAVSQGCLGCLDACLGRIGCSVLVAGLLGWGVCVLVSHLSGAP